MSRRGVSLLPCIALALTVPGLLTAQGTPPAATGAASTSDTEKSGLDVLKGAWVRPDGGYTIVIRNIGANGQLEAMYFNPN